MTITTAEWALRNTAKVVMAGRELAGSTGMYLRLVRQARVLARWAAALLAVGTVAIPLIAGTLRLVQLAGGPELIPADPRFASTVLPLVLHIVGAATYALVGALQFVPRFRRRHRTWHRRAGRVLTVAGLLVAGSALWMTLLYAQKPGTGDLLYVMRLVFGSAMAGCLVLGFTAIRRHDIAAHRAWMIRAYAIGLAAGTQAFTEGVSGAVLGTGELRDDLAKGAGWAINLAVAEWVIRRPARLRSRRRSSDTGARHTVARTGRRADPSAAPAGAPT